MSASSTLALSTTFKAEPRSGDSVVFQGTRTHAASESDCDTYIGASAAAIVTNQEFLWALKKNKAFFIDQSGSKLDELVNYKAITAQFCSLLVKTTATTTETTAERASFVFHAVSEGLVKTDDLKSGIKLTRMQIHKLCENQSATDRFLAPISNPEDKTTMDMYIKKIISREVKGILLDSFPEVDNTPLDSAFEKLKTTSKRKANFPENVSIFPLDSSVVIELEGVRLNNLKKIKGSADVLISVPTGSLPLSKKRVTTIEADRPFVTYQEVGSRGFLTIPGGQDQNAYETQTGVIFVGAKNPKKEPEDDDDA